MVTLQEGKFYKARNGCMIGPMEEEIDGDYMAVHPVTGDTASWHPDGTRFKHDPDYVLIAEWQEVAMETGTLKELNVKPGDVVEWLFADGKAEGTPYTIENIAENTARVSWPSDDEGVTVGLGIGTYRIISRAQTTPDLTAITTPFGLLDGATQEALRAHGGPYEMWDGEEWDEGIPSWYGDCTYRVKPSSVIETVTLYGWPDQFLGNTTGAEPLIMTYQTFDGEPDWSTLKVEAR